MEITISDVLMLDGFESSRMIAGLNGSENFVENIAVLEITDILLEVEPGTLLLSTLYPVFNNEEQEEDVIDKFVGMGVSGLALKLNRAIDSVPEQFITQADARGFPVIALPDNCNFAALTNDYLRFRADLHTGALEHRDSIHSKLLGLMLKGLEYDKLSDSLYSTLSKSVVLLDEALVPLSRATAIAEPVDMEWFRELPRNWREEFKGYRTRPLGDGYACIYGIKDGVTFVGYISVYASEPFELSHTERITIEQFAAAFRIIFHKQRAMDELEKRYIDEFFYDLISQKLGEQVAVGRAKRLGWELRFPAVMIVIKAEANKPINRHSLFDSLRTRVESEVVDKAGLLFANHEDNFVIVASDSTRYVVESLCIAAADYLSGLHDVSYHIGASASIASFGRLPKAYEEARLANKVAGNIGADSPVYFNELGIHRVIHLNENRQELRDYCMEVLGGVLQYDEVNKACLYETLQVIMSEDGNLRRASDRMFIHYNTMRYRFKKLEQLLGRRLSGIIAYQDVFIAMKIYESIA